MIFTICIILLYVEFALLIVFLFLFLTVILFFCVFLFFFSSRIRHTICALVTGVQTCALPIYSMKSARHKRYTVDNNINATHNLLAALVETGIDAHLVHLGTMGVYGYGTHGAPIPEGYLPVQIRGGAGDWVEQEILHPASPGSVYHMTKVLDQHLFQYYNRNDGLRITDLHQGIVWGTQTPETERDERLINRFRSEEHTS